MKKFYLIIILLFINLKIFAQDIQVANGGFEAWNTVTYFENPANYISSNDSYFITGLASVLKTNDSYHGSYALKVQTVAVNTDTTIGYVQLGRKDLMNQSKLGFSFTEKPTFLHCYVKYNCPTSDQASILINFKKNGQYISFNNYYFKGIQSTYKELSIPLQGMTVNPDTVIIEISSSALAKKKKTMSLNPGNWLIIDYISFTGAATQIPNNDFEQWNSTSNIDPVGWSTLNNYFVTQDSLPYASRTTVAHSGSDALKIKSSEAFFGTEIRDVSCITTGNYGSSMFNSDGTPIIKGGFRINSIPDSVRFWYKYDNSINSQDSGLFILELKNNDSVRRVIKRLGPINVYTYISLPLPKNILFTNDTANIILSSVDYTNPVNLGPGNILYIDDISFYYSGLGYNLSGSVTYDNTAATPLSNNILIYLKNYLNKKIDSVKTDISGNYKFLKVQPGTYSLEAHTTKAWRIANSTDALKINRYYIGTFTITDNLRIAGADVNLDKRVNPTDALTVLKRFIGSVSSFKSGDWIFGNPTITIATSDLISNFKGICTADVSGSYIPPAN